MFPQSELDNYKLQVELLQEKLQRSEERRQQLQDKFENIMRKRGEHERLMRAKSRLKYQQFLQDQSERNERNKSLVRALERIDQQASTLAARSERLKILKVQYELYFSQALQFRGSSNALFNYSIYSHPPTMPISSNLNYSVDSSSANTKTPFALATANVGDYEAITPEMDAYRHADIIYPEDPMVSHSGIIPQKRRCQVNWRPNVKHLITTRTPTGISSQIPHNQSSLFSDTRMPIDSGRYKAKDPKVIERSFSGNIAGSSRERTGMMVSGRPWSSQHNLRENANETLESHRSYGSIDNLQHVSSSSSQGSEPPQSPERFLAPDLQPQPFKLDKLHPINRDEALGKMLAKLYDDGSRKDGEDGRKSAKKSQARCTMEGKNMSVIKERIIDAMESKLTPAHITENVRADDMSTCNNATVALNRNGHVDKLGADYVPNIKKKEKLSIETIENAIYGERISPAPTLSERKLNLEKLGQEFTENLTIESHDSFQEMNNNEEKSKENEKEYHSNEKLLDNNQPQEHIENENFTQLPSQEYIDNKVNMDLGYKAPDNEYGVQDNNEFHYATQQYQNIPENYTNPSQYQYIDHQPSQQDFTSPQSSEQMQEYVQPQEGEQTYVENNESFETNATAEYQNQPEVQYSQYSAADYPQQQYSQHDQSYPQQYSVEPQEQYREQPQEQYPRQHQEHHQKQYVEQQIEQHPEQYPAQFPEQHPEQYAEHHPEQYPEQHPEQYPEQHPQQYAEQHPQQYPEQHPEQYPEQYPTTEYNQHLSDLSVENSQNQPVDIDSYIYQQQTVDNNAYDLKPQIYSETPYDNQAAHSDQPGYYQYENDGEASRGEFNQPPSDYAGAMDDQQAAPYQTDLTQPDTEFTQSNPPDSGSDFDSMPLEAYQNDAKYPSASSSEETNSQEMPNNPEQPESVKPTSILTAVEKSSPVAVKGKKKKRVNFVESEENSPKANSNGKADQKLVRSESSAKSASNNK